MARSLPVSSSVDLFLACGARLLNDVSVHSSDMVCLEAVVDLCPACLYLLWMWRCRWPYYFSICIRSG
jgi:hypothetical protein